MRITALRKITILALLLILLLSPVPSAAALAQESVILESMQVDIWPEYDQPSVLIIYHIKLSPQTSLPASLSLRIPAEVGSPYAVAMQDPAGLYNLDYKMNAAGEWIEISFTTPVPDVRIEYYDPNLVITGDERSYVYRWPGDYQVQNFSLTVQQPPTATDMMFKPALGEGSPGEDGLTYYNYLVGPVDAGTTFDLSVSYNKPDDQLTSASQFQPAQPQEPVNVTTDGRIAFNQVLPWGLAGLSLLLILTGSIWYWRAGRTSQPANGRPRHARKAASSSDGEESGAIFCHQCGKKAGAGDLFCRACGTKLK
jgi:hypothetical protein